MRTIKFRGKTKKDSQWVYGSVVISNEWARAFIHSEEKSDGAFIELVAREVIPETTGEFTGLKDKIGKEIYEGDVVKRISKWDTHKMWDEETEDFEETTDIVVFKNAEFRLLQQVKLVSEVSYELEVIGNIYGTPEILKK